MADLTAMMQAAAGAGAAGGENLYIEDVFSTYLYTGTGAAQTITNGIDLDGEGGLVWIKSRSAATNHFLFDTERGVTDEINSNTTDAEASLANSLTAFNSDGFSISSATGIGVSAATYCSWTFRKAPKFFDVVTYTGNGSDPRNISHNLGSVPGCIIIKCTSTSATDWFVYHRSLGNTKSLNLNQTGAAETGTAIWGTTTPTSTVFTVGNINSNTNGRTYVAYLFAHDAGGFGSTNTDNVISCGSFTTDGSGNATVNLGYEPQWILRKQFDGLDFWNLSDSMRGMSYTNTASLYPNSNSAEYIGPTLHTPTATGFNVTAITPNAYYIYIAIRRGL